MEYTDAQRKRITPGFYRDEDFVVYCLESSKPVLGVDCSCGRRGIGKDFQGFCSELTPISSLDQALFNKRFNTQAREFIKLKIQEIKENSALSSHAYEQLAGQIYEAQQALKAVGKGNSLAKMVSVTDVDITAFPEFDKKYKVGQGGVTRIMALEQYTKDLTDSVKILAN
ncbi:hypothetical protein J4225_01805 [Candidatus Pacearchaeota archaeon]|nr:hypothetical protein [Candidatus Pacearchaeota archaeon]